MLLCKFYQVYFLVMFNVVCLPTSQSVTETLYAKKFEAFGPGLQANFAVPARYFFIKLTNENVENVTTPLTSDDDWHITLSDKDGHHIRAYMQKFTRKDGTLLVRFRIFRSYEDGFMINIKYNSEHISNSPIRLHGPVYAETCNCPISMTDWLAAMKCPEKYEQILSDLKPFTMVNMTFVLEKAQSRFSNKGAHCFCHYVIKSNKVYRECYGAHTGFKMFMDNILLSLLRKVELPDVEFIINLGDWPLELGSGDKNLLPIFSWCGSSESYDIVLPTYDLTESTLESLGRVTLDMLSVQGNTGPHWVDKVDKAFFRGRDSRQERLDLAKMSREFPDKIDAGLTNYFFFKQNDELYGEKKKHQSFFDFFKYRYQVNIDGTVAAYRFPYLLAGDSLVLKQDSPYYEFFYNQIKPYEHYVPFARNLSNLLEQIDWARENQDKVQRIISNAQLFARENLQSKDVYCYHAKLFQEYSKRLVEDVKISKTMTEAEQPNDAVKCSCKQPAREEL